MRALKRPYLPVRGDSKACRAQTSLRWMAFEQRLAPVANVVVKDADMRYLDGEIGKCVSRADVDVAEDLVVVRAQLWVRLPGALVAVMRDLMDEREARRRGRVPELEARRRACVAGQ